MQRGRARCLLNNPPDAGLEHLHFPDLGAPYEALQPIVKECLAFDPNARPTASELCTRSVIAQLAKEWGVEFPANILLN